MFVVLRLNIEGLINEEIWTLLLKLADLHPVKILVFPRRVRMTEVQ